MSIPTHINFKKTKAIYEIVQKKQVEKKVIKTVIKTVLQPEIKKLVQSASTTKDINNQIIEYKDKKYVVCYCPFKDNDILFVTDFYSEEKYKDLVNKSWHYRLDGGYIASSAIGDDENKKELYLHNYVMGKLTYNGKGQHHTIDHINRIGRDNRTENLRELTQSHQNINQSKREREIKLPDDCNIDPNDIPKNIYYKPQSGAHGERFYIEIKTPEIVQVLCLKKENDLVSPKFRWFGTKCKTLDLRVKLEQAINKLEDLRKQHPEIADLIYAVDNVDEKNKLIQSFNDILDLTTYPKEVIEENKGKLLEQHNPISITEVQEQLVKEIEEKTIRGLKCKLPEDCGITPMMIPKHCYYQAAIPQKRGDKFLIDKHPKLDKRQWCTTESKKFTTKQKFDLLLQKVEELNKL